MKLMTQEELWWSVYEIKMNFGKARISLDKFSSTVARCWSFKKT